MERPQLLRRVSDAFIDRHSHGHGHTLPMLRLPPTVRNHVVAMSGEFVGTFLFLFMAFAGTQIANTPPPLPDGEPNPAALIFICLTFGLSLTANVWAFYRVTGGLFNPAVCFLSSKSSPRTQHRNVS